MACGAIAWEAIDRIAQPPIVASLTVSSVAAIGIVINGLSAWLLMKNSRHDLNIRGAYLHMLADTAVSLTVVIGGLTMFYLGWYWLDPIMTIVIVMVIMVGTLGLLRDSLRLALSAVPAHIDAHAIDHYLRQLDGVVDIHDLHIWGLSTSENALTVHLVIPGDYPGDAFMDTIAQNYKSTFLYITVPCKLNKGRPNMPAHCWQRPLLGNRNFPNIDRNKKEGQAVQISIQSSAAQKNLNSESRFQDLADSV